MATAEQEIAAALERGDAAAVHYWQTVIRIADEAPEFDAEIKAKLRPLLQLPPRTIPAEPKPVTPRRRIPARRSPKTQAAAPLPTGTAA